MHTLAHVTRRITHEDDFVSRVPPPLWFSHVGKEWKCTPDGKLMEGYSRSLHEQIVDRLDQCAAWMYGRMPVNTMQSVLASPGLNLPGQSVNPISICKTSKPKRKLGLQRLGSDIWSFTTKNSYGLSFITWKIAMGSICAIFAMYVVWCLIRGAFNFAAHPSRRYCFSIVKHYSAINLFKVPPGSHEQRKDAEKSLRQALEAYKKSQARKSC